MALDPVTQIDQEITTVASASNDGQSVSARPMQDTIAGLLFQQQAIAAIQARRGITFTTMIKPGPYNGRGCGDGFPGGFGRGGCGC